MSGLADEGSSVDDKMLAGLRIARERGESAPAGPEQAGGLRDATDARHHRALGCRDLYTLDGYRRFGGCPRPAGGPGSRTRMQVIATVKDSGLRGRGGAGFPTGIEVGRSSRRHDGKPHYLVVQRGRVRAGQPAKDIPIMMANPHALV
jgi:NADH:ubiquinone oxidoreductase subunit F (NADH-binding)